MFTLVLFILCTTFVVYDVHINVLIYFIIYFIVNMCFNIYLWFFLSNVLKGVCLFSIIFTHRVAPTTESKVCLSRSLPDSHN